ncbi:MAG: hypothetical protein O7J95_06295 [Planctomycetota bacterium]|nr:hypothetical protein [Planctomycetota bacterium]
MANLTTMEWLPAWLTWVGSTTMCLDALGVECDATDVAGQSGYAFAISVNEGLCPSGPTSLDWAALSTGIMNLGRTTLSYVSGDSYTGKTHNDRTAAHAHAVFELVRRETEAGRPCVVWGLGPPEFGVVRAVDGDEYVCVPGGSTPPRVRWDEVDAPGGPYALGFPTASVAAWSPDRSAIRRGLHMMLRPDHAEGWSCGENAFTFWAAELEGGRALPFGNSYNAQCWAEARTHAREFVGRVASRNSGSLHLARAHEFFGESAGHLTAVAELFPFPQEGESIEDQGLIESAAAEIRAAGQADGRAKDALLGALSEWPAAEDES